MYCTDVMVRQHENIARMAKVITAISCTLMEGAAVDQAEFAQIIDFIRNYADGHHHRREELVLFPEMMDHLPEVATIIIKHGMLVEHDMTRAHVRDLETALQSYAQAPQILYKVQILAEAMAYAKLIQAHVDKENNVVYPMADRDLPQAVQDKIDASVHELEAEEGGGAFTKKYLDFLASLEKKYHLA